jgi:hypothetical protein
LAKIYRTAAFAVSALDRKLGGIERRRADSLVMMIAMCLRSYASVVGYESALEHDVLALDRTCVSVQTNNAVEPAN